MFGAWTQRVDALAAEFRAGRPFKHVVIPDFFADAERVRRGMPGYDSSWCVYRNPIENKQTFNDVSRVAALRETYDALAAPEFVAMVERITGLAVEADPHLHGAGVHRHARGGKLDVHLDYCIHPLTGKQRRLNLIVYMTPGWRDAWGGHLELWTATPGGELDACAKRVRPDFNTAVIFETTDDSWHGMPTPLACPEGVCRLSIAAYYVSDPLPGATRRSKALFRPLQTPSDERVKALYDIRSTRVLTDADLWDDWDAL